MAGTNTNTALYDSEGNNRTGTHLSTNIVIKVGDNVVGAVQEMSVDEQRDVKMIDEVGTDGSIDSAPTSSAKYTGSCQRIRFARVRIAHAFQRGFVHVGSQRIPFDIEIHDIFADSDQNNAIVTVLKNVWITKIGYKYGADNWIITETMDFKAETIFSFVNSTNGNVVTDVAYRNTFEQAADRGQLRGALDAAGILNAFLDDPTV